MSRRLLAICCAVAVAAGCARVPYVGRGPHPQVVRGRPFFPIDVIGNVWSLPIKLILWDWRVENHAISEKTETLLVEYLDTTTLPAFEDTTYRLNQYSPWGDIKALWKNKHVAWPYRIFPGLLSVAYSAVLPGRIFGGDHFNPWTNVVSIYSDEPSIALHEAGHAYDYGERRFKGSYALLRMLPFVDLHQEWRASTYAVTFLKRAGHREEELRAYKILTPAYGSYAGHYVVPPFGTLAGIMAGHGLGRSEARAQRRRYQQQDARAAAERAAARAAREAAIKSAVWTIESPDDAELLKLDAPPSSTARQSPEPGAASAVQ